MMSEYTNRDRANAAMTGLQPYINEKGIGGEDLMTQAGDMICDLLHLIRLDGDLPEIHEFDAAGYLAGRAACHDIEMNEDSDE